MLYEVITWQTLDPRELLGDDARHYEKVKDTLDVWFDSGSTHQTVLQLISKPAAAVLAYGIEDGRHVMVS